MESIKLTNKTLGGAAILAGTSIGAGMIALPLITASIGFKLALLVIVAVWVLATWSGLLIADICQKDPDINSFYGLLSKYFGTTGQLIGLIAICCLPYILCIAYISGASGQLQGMLDYFMQVRLPIWTCLLSVTAVFSSIIIGNTNKVDLVTRFLFIVKIATFISLLVILSSKAQGQHLSENVQPHNPWLTAIPLLFTSFGFQATVPSIVLYLGRDKAKCTKALLLGSLAPITIYLAWIMAITGIVPESVLVNLHKQHDPVSALTIAISQHIQSGWVTTLISLFAGLALATSFLGVALGLFDYINEAISKHSRINNRYLTAALTFIPPLLVSLKFSDSFIKALNYAAIPLVILALFFPIIIMWKSKKTHSSNNNFLFSKPLLFLGALFGLLIIIAQFIA